jgi:hypothetical protein
MSTPSDEGGVSIAVVKLTDENRESLGWLAMAQMLEGKKCVYCGFEWKSREDVKSREPIAASQGAATVACEPCWKEHHL